MTGIELTDHTNRYIREVFAKAIEGSIFVRNYSIFTYFNMFRCKEYKNK